MGQVFLGQVVVEDAARPVGIAGHQLDIGLAVVFVAQPGAGLLLGIDQALHQLGVFADEIASAQQHRLGTAGTCQVTRVDR
ncbi:hypothetical protein D9M71_799050 [compost metagenome]